MAIIRMGPVITAVSGAVGGVEFAAARGATVLRRRQHKLRRNSPSALTSNAAYLKTLHSWRALTGDQKLQWNASAANLPLIDRLGNARTLTGQQAYFATARQWIENGFDPAIAPPVVTVAAQPSSITISNTTAAALQITFNGFAPVLFNQVSIWAALSPDRPTNRPPKYQRRLGAMGLPGSGILNLIPSWPTDAAKPAIGWTVYLSAVNLGFRQLPSARVYAQVVAT